MERVKTLQGSVITSVCILVSYVYRKAEGHFSVYAKCSLLGLVYMLIRSSSWKSLLLEEQLNNCAHLYAPEMYTYLSELKLFVFKNIKLLYCWNYLEIAVPYRLYLRTGHLANWQFGPCTLIF